MSLGGQIKDARNHQGFTQTELAERAGVSRPTVARVESGDDVSTATLEKVAAALGLKVELRGEL
jgi:transcriptional regulator with XRE-family HTH domain